MTVELETSGVSPTIARAIRQVYTKTGGVDLARGVLDVAADPKSPLHGCFEWDDTEAGEKYRLLQADGLIRRVRVTILPSDENAAPVKVRAYVSGNQLAGEGLDLGDELPTVGRYLAIEAVSGHTRDEEALLAAIRRDLLRVQRKYSGIKEFSRLVRELFPDG